MKTKIKINLTSFLLLSFLLLIGCATFEITPDTSYIKNNLPKSYFGTFKWREAAHHFGADYTVPGVSINILEVDVDSENNVVAKGTGKYSLMEEDTNIDIKIKITPDTLRFEMWEMNTEGEGGSNFVTDGSHVGTISKDLKTIYAIWFSKESGNRGDLLLKANCHTHIKSSQGDSIEVDTFCDKEYEVIRALLTDLEETSCNVYYSTPSSDEVEWIRSSDMNVFLNGTYANFHTLSLKTSYHRDNISTISQCNITDNSDDVTLRISRVGFSIDEKQALIYVGDEHNAEYFLFMLEDNQWKKTEHYQARQLLHKSQPLESKAYVTHNPPSYLWPYGLTSYVTENKNYRYIQIYPEKFLLILEEKVETIIPALESGGGKIKLTAWDVNESVDHNHRLIWKIESRGDSWKIEDKEIVIHQWGCCDYLGKLHYFDLLTGELIKSEDYSEFLRRRNQ